MSVLSPHSNDKYQIWSDLTFILLTVGCLFFALLGIRPLFTPDEGRYAEIAREMIVSQDYVTPYLNGIHYFEKPILFYWLSALAIKVGGLNLWSIRGINACLGIIGILATYLATYRIYNRRTGLFAAFILATSLLYFVMAHMISLDLPVTVFLAISLYTFLIALDTPASKKKRNYIWLSFASAALAVLTKGLIGIVFPAMIVGPWLLFTGEWRQLHKCYLPSAIGIFLLITVPWHIAVNMRNPGFFYFYFIEQHFLRYTTKEIGHYQPAWFFLPVLVLGFFPWIVFLPQTIAKFIPKKIHELKTQKKELFFILWSVLIFIFFSFSKSKLIPYILPMMPPIAILTARYIDRVITKSESDGVRLGFSCLLLLSFLIAYVYFSFPYRGLLPDVKQAIFYLYSAALVLLIGSFTSFYYAFRQIKKAFIITIVTMCLFSILSLAAIPAVDTRTILPLAQKIKPILTLDDEVITYNQYFQDLPFYLERQVSILNWQNELSYGMTLRNTSGWMIDDKTFWERWRSDKRLFVFISLPEYNVLQKNYPHEKFYVLGSTINTVLISNQLNSTLLSNFSFTPV